MKKSLAWVGTIISLILFLILLGFGIYIQKTWLIIVASIISLVYIFALVILIIDYFQTKEEFKPEPYRRKR